jgi:hypothetical protein
MRLFVQRGKTGTLRRRNQHICPAPSDICVLAEDVSHKIRLAHLTAL